MTIPVLELRLGSLTVAIPPGCHATVGRGSPEHPADLRIAKSLDLSRKAAVVHHGEPGRWSVEAVSSKNGVAVRHECGSVVLVPTASRRDMPEWFTDVYLVITTPSDEYQVRIVAAERAAEPRVAPIGPAEDKSTEIVLPRNLASASYQTALMLCEPMLDDPFNRRVPTQGEIASCLVKLGLLEPNKDKDGLSRTIEHRLEKLRKRINVSTNMELRDRLVSAGLVTRADLDRIRGRES